MRSCAISSVCATGHNINTQPSQNDIADVLDEITGVVREATDHDFSQYKTSTLIRRIHRRMQLLQLADPQAYLHRLREDVDECRGFFEEMLIGVTRFFRDPASFEVLADQIIPQLFEGRSPDEQVRVWVPACASGQEIYSIAMLVCEHLEKMGANTNEVPAVKLLGTDIDERSLRIARQGLYSAKHVRSVDEERLERFFRERDGHYQVIPALREMCLFSSHNLVSDPPFSRIDLISCRNLLIYLGSTSQNRIFPLFHYALNDNGYLFLGSSETLTTHEELFREVDLQHRIWQRRDTGEKRPAAGARIAARSSRLPRRRDDHADVVLDVESRMRRAMVERHAPTTAVISSQGRVICSSEGLGRYLELAGGRFQNNVVKMARTGLRVGLRAGLQNVQRTGERSVHPDLSIRTDDGVQPVRLVVEPLSYEDDNLDLYLLVFHDEGPVLSGDETPMLAHHDDEAESLIEHLERELASTRADLERTVQELEASNEELKSSNEELLSMNEELQSGNEELEVSKDEVQAANRALSEAKSDLENLLESTQIATLFLDRNGCVQQFTPAVGEIYNLRRRDRGRPLSEITHCVDEMPELPTAPELAEASDSFEDELHTADGRRYLRRVHPYRGDEGPTGGVVMTFIDVTELKRAEEQASELAAHLERSKRQAEDASRSKSQFLANMSHEIRTPMTAILGYAQLLLQHLEDPDDRQSVETIMRNGNFLLEIINDILDLSKIEAGQLDVTQSRVAPDELVAEVASLMYVRAEEKGLPLEVEFDGLLPESVETDPRRVRQILVNLVGNALKFTDDGSVRIKVGLDHKTNELCFEVIDTGIGISEDHLETLFDPFTQADSSGTRQYGGTGLGLTICSRLADAIGGSIKVESKPGKGSTFCLSIPSGADEDLALVEPREGIVVPEESDVSEQIQLDDHVLVVDDRHEIRYLARYFIEQAGGTTACAGNGRQAIDKIREAEEAGKPFDLVVMDMQMPVMDGYQATRALRNEGFERPILALTAGAMRGDRRKCLEAGCDDHIGKPIDGHRLVAYIARYGKNTAQPEPANPAEPTEPSEPTEPTEPTEPQQQTAAPSPQVLLVEDNDDTRQAMSALLEMSGFHAVGCPDGKSALECAREHQPAAILLDLGLPDISGFEVCEQLRELDELEDTVIIALTGRASDQDKQETREAGFDHHVTKPPKPGELIELLGSCAKVDRVVGTAAE